MIRAVRFRPSSRSRFRQAEAELTPAELHLVAATFAAADAGLPLPSFETLSPPRRALALDAALGWIDYKEGLAGAMPAVRYQAEQAWLLAQRAALGSVDDGASGGSTVPAPARSPPAARPDLVDPPSARASGADVITRDAISSRPTGGRACTLGDSPPDGYTADLQIEMMRLQIRRLTTSGRTEVSAFRLFDAISLPSIEPLMTPPAWRLALGAERELFGNEALRRYIELGGLALAPGGGTLTAYALGTLQVGWSPAFAGHWLVEPAILSGLLYAPLPSLMLAATWRPSRTFAAGGGRVDHRLRISAARQPVARLELMLYGDRFGGDVELGGQVAVYF